MNNLKERESGFSGSFAVLDRIARKSGGEIAIEPGTGRVIGSKELEKIREGRLKGDRDKD
jgi:hypothetical protein